MNPLIQLKKTLPLLITLTLLCIGLSSTAQAVSPAPDGGYPGGNTAEGTQGLQSLTSGISNTVLGFQALFSNTTGYQNMAAGKSALFSNTTGNLNTAAGEGALYANTTGTRNTANGFSALGANQTGNDNTATGFNALQNNTTGINNVALGVNAGQNLTTGSNNIEIANAGVAGESGTIRIGRPQTRAFIAGIRGATTGMPDAVPVLIDSAGQLGTASSSRRFKKEIKPMDKVSEAILALKPVAFQQD
jgi:hypothetical protein